MNAETQIIWNNFSAAVTRFVRARVQNQADAADIVQDIFLRIHTRRSQVRQDERIAGWVFRIAANAVTDHFRGRTVSAELDTDSAAPAQAEEELAMCVRPFIEMLDEPYREALLLTDIDGLTQAEAAARVGISVSGMKSRVQRGRQKLRGSIEACCVIDTDVRGGVMDYEIRDPCGCEESTTADQSRCAK